MSVHLKMDINQETNTVFWRLKIKTIINDGMTNKEVFELKELIDEYLIKIEKL
jgi:hypothetical protein